MARPILSEREVVAEGLFDMWLEELAWYSCLDELEEEYDDIGEIDDGWDDRAIDFDEWERDSEPLYDDWDDSSCRCSICGNGVQSEEVYG